MFSLDQIVLEALNKVWIRRIQLNFEAWHAYGLRLADDGPRAAVFVEPGFDTEILQDALIAELQTFLASAEIRKESPKISAEISPFEEIQMPPFRQMGSGSEARMGEALRPGGRVFTTSSLCSRGCSGTIGGFLRPLNGVPNGSAWLISNHHILAADEECTQGVQVRGAGGTLISSEVAFVHLKETETNDVDVAAAKVESFQDSLAIYPEIDLQCPTPISAQDNMTVWKLGNATSVTSGIVVYCCPKVIVSDCTNGDAFEFENQLVIGSKSEREPFLAHGDSGALVVGDQHPVGLLFAIGDPSILPPGVRAIPPLGIASPFVNVLRELPPAGSSWQLVLASASTPCREHLEVTQDACLNYLASSRDRAKMVEPPSAAEPSDRSSSLP